MARVVWTPQALDDLNAVCEYIAHDSPAFARVFAQRAFAAVGRLERFPGSGRMVPELGREDVREVILSSYRIIYRLERDEVQIVTPHHGVRLTC